MVKVNELIEGVPQVLFRSSDGGYTPGVVLVDENGDTSPAVKFIDENDVSYGVKHVSNKPRVSSTPYYVDIAEGNIADHQAVYKFGNNESAGTTEQSIWAEGGLYPWDAIDSASGTVTASSSSAQDNPSGTGIATIQIYGINADTGEDQNEVLIMNGQTAISSTLSYKRVFRIICRTSGSASTTDKNIGIIYVGTGAISTGKPAVVWALVPVGRNQTLQAVWTVPAGKTFSMTDASFSVGGAKGAEGVMYVRPPGELFQVKFLSHHAGGVDVIPFTFPLRFSAGTDIDMRATAIANSTEITSTFSGWYE